MLNKVQLIGNVGQDPEIKSTQDGREIASFSLATTESWKDKTTGEKKDKTEWHNVVVFSQGLVGIIKNYVKKGSKLYIEGSLQTTKYTDKEGIERYTTKIILQGFGSKLIMLGSKPQPKQDEEGFNQIEEAFDNQKAKEFEMDDSVPF
jgi:single-strand DNA-binding protein